MNCPECGFGAPAGHRFCGACGARLPELPAEAALSIVLSGAIDPEALLDVTRAWEELAEGVLQEHGGRIVQRHGEHLLAAFGPASSLEGAASRAVRAARALVDAAATLGDVGRPQSARGAVHAGLVDLDEAAAAAGRLLGLAAPGTVLVSEATRRLTPGNFAWIDRGQLPGDDGVRAYEAADADPGESHFARSSGAGLSPFVGREAELDLLTARWERAQRGLGSLVLITGEAGVGKSRLLHALARRHRIPAEAWLVAQCQPQTRTSAFHPLQAMHRRLTDDGFAPGDGSTPHRARRQQLDALTSLLVDRAQRTPLLFVLEDLQWADASTLELLAELATGVHRLPLLIAASARESFGASWPLGRGELRIALAALEPEEARQLATSAGPELPRERVETVLARTGGVPLFVEELARLALDGAAELPPTVEATLGARLRPDDDEPLLQVAAAMGPGFSRRVLAPRPAPTPTARWTPGWPRGSSCGIWSTRTATASGTRCSATPSGARHLAKTAAPPTGPWPRPCGTAARTSSPSAPSFWPGIWTPAARPSMPWRPGPGRLGRRSGDPPTTRPTSCWSARSPCSTGSRTRGRGRAPSSAWWPCAPPSSWLPAATPAPT